MIRALACCLLTASAFAAPVAIPHGSVELITENGAIRPNGTLNAGLHFTLEKGWHIYWINPGDAGQPPRISWQLPPGLSAGEIQWPAPKPLPAFSLVDFGYEDEILLMVPIKAASGLPSSGNVTLNANLKFIVCREVCIPGKNQLSLSVPVGTGAPNPSSKALFESTRKRLPKPSPTSWRFTALSKEGSFRLVGRVGRQVKSAFFFPLDTGQIENAAPQKVEPLKGGFQMTLKKSDQLSKPIQQLRGVLMVDDQPYLVSARVK